MNIGELFFLFSLLALLIGPFAYFKLWWWFWTMVVIGIWIVGVEVYSKFFSKEKRTISSRFWHWSIEKDEEGKLKNRGRAWTVLGLLLLGWLSLLVHLGWKLLFA